mmetsp:Transcript_116682/g.341565  ORF Transcript_116682/g.341565 Transcript_116682/m.341565 type:complete len:207 (+) Transcript_116682:437-1057(+)
MKSAAELIEGRHKFSHCVHEALCVDYMKHRKRPCPWLADEGLDVCLPGWGKSTLRIKDQRHVQAIDCWHGCAGGPRIQFEHLCRLPRDFVVDLRLRASAVQEECVYEWGCILVCCYGLKKRYFRNVLPRVLRRDESHRGNKPLRNDITSCLAPLHSKLVHCVQHRRERCKVTPLKYPLHQSVPAVNAPGACTPVLCIGYHTSDELE